MKAWRRGRKDGGVVARSSSQNPGTIIILNGAPRAGKSSIARAIANMFDGVWLNLGVDSWAQATPPHLLPGIGLRPGGERPDLEPQVRSLFAALYEAIAASARTGANVVVDVGHHDAYSKPLGILGDCARRLNGLPAILVGVLCPLDVIMARRNADSRDGFYEAGEMVPAPVALWQVEVHRPGIYDLEVDTSILSADDCATAIRNYLAGPEKPGAVERLARL